MKMSPELKLKPLLYSTSLQGSGRPVKENKYFWLFVIIFLVTNFIFFYNFDIFVSQFCLFMSQFGVFPIIGTFYELFFETFCLIYNLEYKLEFLIATMWLTKRLVYMTLSCVQNINRTTKISNMNGLFPCWEA